MVAVVIDVDTGEILQELTDGYTIITAEEKQRRLEHRQRRIERRTPKGVSYVFVNAEQHFEELSPSTTAKLIYLSTYVNYEGILVSGRTPIKKQDLSRILGISPASAYNFWKEVSPMYITEDEDSESLFLNREYFTKGSLERKTFKGYQKLFCDGIRSLYELNPTSKHKYIGYLFKLLPFINREWNALCTPDSVYLCDLALLNLISIDDFCEFIGYQKVNISRLMKMFNSLYFEIEGMKQKACFFQYNFRTDNGAKMVINPFVLYSGPDKTRDEIQRDLFIGDASRHIL